ncbi:MAG: DUF1501 domain-containing protein [Akkermansiaceae bacterium]|nr:DUF1501 domain-containing protein [Akkermansiaceae bacterium]MDP4646307.1 DUF1501 domain-containing protein [Akkermansiaceae bacterium]MDP4721459.1 DUF1501 domain-containing protein [Akkermansiaceae bacterium]MDP4779852.1 DUF1501 domain-containing protein [Akkermansiaceae bacterium]MDP4845819.1 DUF1501 domain-containing protein [Akkermansiaceae bacterium]
MDPIKTYNDALTRRQFFRKSGTGLGAAALASLLGGRILGADGAPAPRAGVPHFAPKAKRVIYISLIGAPSQFETFDYKPELQKRFQENLTDYLAKEGQRLTGMTSGQASFPLAPSRFEFSQHGESGTWISELLPWHGKMADDICVIKSMHTDAINHEPANQLICTGSMQNGKASMGSWLSYGLGSMNEDLPAFVVLNAQHSSPFSNVQAISNRLWSSGYLPGKYSGVSLRSAGDPVLFLKDAPGVPRELRRAMLDGLGKMNQRSFDAVGDPDIQTRMQQYELAYRMQTSVPELADTSGESEHTYELYGEDSRKDGTFAASALMARRLVERGVRFVQIFHRGWDQHNNLPRDITSQCKDVDQGCYALIQDLKQRGMLDDTLVVWGGEFGRTVYSQGALTETNYGRDHHPRCFSMWMAGAGVKGGQVYGETDELSYNITENPVHVRDLHATILHAMGLDHLMLSFKAQGLDERLTGVNPAKVIHDLFA